MENGLTDKSLPPRGGPSHDCTPDSPVLTPCGESFFQKSPPALETRTSTPYASSLTTSHVMDTTVAWQQSVTTAQNESRPEFVDLSCDGVDNERLPLAHCSTTSWNTPCSSSTLTNGVSTNGVSRTDDLKRGAVGDGTSPGTSFGQRPSSSTSCNRGVTPIGKSTPTGFGGKTLAKKIGNSLPDDGYRSKLYIVKAVVL